MISGFGLIDHRTREPDEDFVKANIKARQASSPAFSLGVCWKNDRLLLFSSNNSPHPTPLQYGIKKKEEREAEAQAALEANAEGSLTRPKKAIPPGCGDEDEEEEESILDTVIKYLPGPLQDMFKK